MLFSPLQQDTGDNKASDETLLRKMLPIKNSPCVMIKRYGVPEIKCENEARLLHQTFALRRLFFCGWDWGIFMI